MAQFILPKTAHPDFAKPWQKPSGRVVIDESNPLAKHIVSAYINTPTGWHDICGRGPSYDPSTGLIPDNPAHEENEYRTYGFVLAPGTTGYVYKKTNEASGNRTIRVNITSSTNVQFLNGGNTGGWANDNFSVNVPGDKPFFLAASVTYLVPGNEYKQVYCDRSHDLNTGNYADGFIDTTYDWDLPQGFELFVIWNRMFSEEEFHALNSNPYQIFKPAVDLGWYYSAGGGGDTNVAAGPEALTLTTYDATIALDVDVSASAEALTLTAYSATVSTDTDIAASTEALALTSYGASIAFDVTVSASTEALTLTTYPATLSADVNISANTEALTLASYAADIAFDIDVSANNEALTLTTYSATVSAGLNINASTETLTLTSYGASIAYDVDIAANTEGLTLTTFIASVSDGTEFDVNASAEALALTSYPATIHASSEFTFPVVDNFSGLWITDPLDKIQVLETDGTEKSAYAFDDGYIQHAQPIQLDRHANIPSIYFDAGDCQVKLYNEHGVEKYSITRTSGLWYVGGITGISVNSASLTLSTYQARINNSINPAFEQLTLSTYNATVDHT